MEVGSNNCSSQMKDDVTRGTCYGIHRTRVMLSLHAATLSVRVRRFNHEGSSSVTTAKVFVSYCN